MDEKLIQVSFIQQWLEQASLDDKLNQSVIEVIKNNMGGPKNESLDEIKLLQVLLDLANGGNNND
jgi:hypothetical protein